MDRDLQIRIALFEWLRQQSAKFGELLSRDLLVKGFELHSERIHVVSQQGIFKPQQLELPISITTVADGPYRDAVGADGLLRYMYRGTDPTHRDNEGLRRVMIEQRPLVYLMGIEKALYLPLWPAYIVADNPAGLAFSVAIDMKDSVGQITSNVGIVSENSDARRRYVTTLVKQRMHQRLFRARVLRAYNTQCTVCRLRHKELLDAAHIIADSDPDGEPVVTNGLSLCKLHHSAFENSIIGIDPSYHVHVREDILLEHDGPMLRHGLQELHQAKLVLPRSQEQWPN